jgi:hypothetical protein
MKKCSRCLKIKNFLSFNLDRRAKTGLSSWCKECIKLFKNTNSFKEYEKNYVSSENSKISKRKYMQSDIGKLVRIKSQHKFKEKNSARMRVRYAVKTNRLIKPNICDCCGKENKYIHGHHKNYLKPLDVVWLCPKCHKEEHKLINLKLTGINKE